MMCLSPLSVAPPETDFGALVQMIDEPLSDVHYWCLKHEASADDIQNPYFYLGGPIRLTFGNGRQVFLVCEERPKGPSRHVVLARREREWLPDYYRDFNATGAPVWKHILGSRLRQIDVMGWKGAPNVAALTFERGTVYVGTGYAGTFGDGDDVMVRGHHAFWTAPEVQSLRILASLYTTSYPVAA
ncbi:MAG: hypothetical protein R2834_13100 [Rhodothermales bacterium]